MKKILSGDTIFIGDEKDCVLDKELYYTFLNELYWPQFISFLKTQSIQYDKLSPLEQAGVCTNAKLLMDFLHNSSRFVTFRGKFFFYTLTLADATYIDLYQLSEDDIVEFLNQLGTKKVGPLRRLWEKVKNFKNFSSLPPPNTQ